jgi:dolichol-phosphate mannosyltransferase
MMQNDTLVVIPTYEERENIERMIEEIFVHAPEVDLLVVDDDSPDRTWELVESRVAGDSRLHLIRRQGKRGLGTAYIAGFNFALERGYHTIVGMDADFSHDPREIPKLVAATDSFDMVQGSRYVGGVRVLDWPLRRLVLSTWANLYARLVTGLPLKDITSGYRCYRREVLEAIDLAKIRSNGYVFLIEMSFLAWCKGFRLGELPIIFQERRVGQSKISKSIIWESIWVVFKLRLLKMFGRL